MYLPYIVQGRRFGKDAKDATMTPYGGSNVFLYASEIYNHNHCSFSFAVAIQLGRFRTCLAKMIKTEQSS